jgi:hypothetical protein
MHTFFYSAKLYLLLLLFPSFSQAVPPLNWFEGTIVFDDLQVLEGLVSYDEQREVICFKKHEQVQAFSAAQVRNFRFFDTEMRILRRFETKKIYQEQDNYISKAFFEIVLDGEIEVVRRAKKTRHSVDNNSRIKTHIEIAQDQIRGYDYYIYFEGVVLELRNFKREILPLLMSTHRDEIAGYIKQHHINDGLLSHNIMLINYYNTIITAR